MQKLSDAIISAANGNPVAGATVTVTNNSDDSAATLYSDNGVTPIVGNTVTAGVDGEFRFYAGNGRYDLTIAGTGLTAETREDVLFFDPDDAVPGAIKDAVARVNSLAALRALTAPSRRTAVISEGDGAGNGCGVYLWSSSSTATDNGGTVVKPDSNPASGRYLLAIHGEVDVMQFGAVGDGVTDDAARIQAALDTGRKVRLTPNRTFAIGTTLSVPSGGGLVAAFDATLTLKNSVNNHVIRVANNADKVLIRGLIINGNKANNTGGHGIAVDGSGGTNIAIQDNYVYDCSAHGILIAGTTATGIGVTGNYVTGCTSGGVTANDTLRKFALDGNFCWSNGTHGVGIYGIAKDGQINNNVCWANGQGTPNADNITGYNVSNENVVVSGNATYGGLNNGIHVGGSRLVISNNTTYGATQYGLAVWPNTGTGDDVVVSGNLSYGNGVSGIWIQNCNSGSVNGNVSRGNAAHGFAIDACTYVSFTGNTARANTLDGFRNGTASSWLAFTGNTSRANGGDGIELANVTLSTVVGNVFSGNTGYGINVSGTEANNIIGANQARSNTAGQIAQPATTTRVSDNETGVSRTIASAATLTLPPGGEYFYVTGTTGITSITVSFPERRVTLQFDDVLTVTDGSNLRMAGNFTTSFMDTITMICDGTNWIECSRSVN